MAIFLFIGFILRYFYHTFSTVNELVVHSKFIDTFYRILIGSTAFLLRITGVPNVIGYSFATIQYSIFLPQTNYVLYLYIPCLGISLMYIYASLIISYPESIKRKVIFVIGGIVIIQVLNVLRLYGLCLLLAQTTTGDNYLIKLTPRIVISHEDIFNWVVILIIFFIFVLYTRNLLSHKQKDCNNGDYNVS
jgi:exosortase/archaeosortase family protein